VKTLVLTRGNTVVNYSRAEFLDGVSLHRDGGVIVELIADIVEIYNNYDWKTEVLAASIRHPMHVIEAAHLGADVATMPFKVMAQLINHPLTEKGLQQFLADWRKAT